MNRERFLKTFGSSLSTTGAKLLLERVGGAGGNSNEHNRQQRMKAMDRITYENNITDRIVGRKNLEYILSIISTLCASNGLTLPTLTLRSSAAITTIQSDEMCDVGLSYDDSNDVRKFKECYDKIKDHYYYSIDEEDYDGDRTIGLIKYAANEGEFGSTDVIELGKDKGFHIEEGY